MIRREYSIQKKQSRNGASLALIAVLLPVVIVLCGFAVNVAQMQLTRTELQAATDASARAAGKRYFETNDLAQALDIANQLGRGNLVSGSPMQFDASDIELGVSTRSSLSSSYQFSSDSSSRNSLRLNGRRTNGSLSGPVPLLFPIFNRKNFETSIAAVSTQIELDIALVIDRSGSMAYADTEPAVYPPVPAAAPPEWYFGDPAPPNARWFAAVSATEAFVTELINSPQQEKVSLVTYADTGTADVPLTFDYLDILAKLGDHTNELSGGGTNIADGIWIGSSALASEDSREFATKVIIVMTDGKNTVGNSPDWVTELVSREGVIVFSVTFSEEADIELMQRVAAVGRGKHFHAKTGSDLITVFKEIGKSLPSLLTE